MQYPDGQDIRLGDTVSVEMPDGWESAFVVMLGDTKDHSDMDAEALDWYRQEGSLAESDIVVQWLHKSHSEPGAYMATNVSCCINLLSRAKQ